MTASTSTFRLLLWPTLITLAISVARVVCEVNGWLKTSAGGDLLPLGITWLMFVFGGWFGWKLSRAGSSPRVKRPWLWPLVALLVTIGVGAIRGHLLSTTTGDEAIAALLREVAIMVSIAALVGALAMFVVWPRLAWALLLYGLIARATVVAITWLAKSNGWNTHYTKFGPTGLEHDMERTMVGASIMQLGFWVGMTVMIGTFVGCLFARRKA